MYTYLYICMYIHIYIYFNINIDTHICIHLYKHRQATWAKRGLATTSDDRSTPLSIGGGLEPECPPPVLPQLSGWADSSSPALETVVYCESRKPNWLGFKVPCIC